MESDPEPEAFKDASVQTKTKVSSGPKTVHADLSEEAISLQQVLASLSEEAIPLRMLLLTAATHSCPHRSVQLSLVIVKRDDALHVTGRTCCGCGRRR